MRQGLLSAFALAVAVAASVPAAGSARSAQAIPEYGALLSAMTGGLQSAKRVYTCPGADLTDVVEALGGPAAVRKTGLELVAGALGKRKKPWPRNRRAFTYKGRRWVPDYVKGRTFYLVDTGRRLDLTSEVRDLEAIARARGGDLVIVTRKATRISAPMSAAISRSWGRRAGRLRVVRCV
jgi:hypothetical protein